MRFRPILTSRVNQSKYSQNFLSVIISYLYIILLSNIIHDIHNMMIWHGIQTSFLSYVYFHKNPHTRLLLNNHLLGQN